MNDGSRWQRTDAPRGDAYDERWTALAASGADVHGEASCVESLANEFALERSVLDAGCGTGRVAIELSCRGFEVVGVDLDATMLEGARRKAPALTWVDSDLAELDLRREFGLAVLAGNVMIFVAPGSEGRVLAALARHVRPGGLLVAGFQVRDDRLSLDHYDAAASSAGFDLVRRHATWDGEPYGGGDYAVSVHRRSISVGEVG